MYNIIVKHQDNFLYDQFSVDQEFIADKQSQ